VITAPRATFHRVAAEPRWVGVLLLTTAVTILSGVLLLRTEVGQLALLDRLERAALAFGQKVDNARYAQLEALSARGPAYATVTGLLEIPALAVGIAALIYVLFRTRNGTPVSFRQLLSVVVHASVILAVREVIAAPIAYAYETLASPTALTRLLPMFDESSPIARFLGMLDAFILWWVAVLAIGVSVLYKRPAVRLIGTFIGGYVAAALLLALVMALSGGIA
jgi:hypothetical protein